MYKLILFLGICSAFALGSMLTKPSEDYEKVRGCHHIIKAPYNDPQAELVKKGIDASVCTHLIYSFVGIGSNGSVEYYDEKGLPDPKKYKPFNGRWKTNPRIKTLAHMINVYDELVGIPDHKSVGQIIPAQVFYDSRLRAKVVNNVFNFVKKYAFDGIDLDFTSTITYPPRPAAEKKNLVLLLQALKDKFDKEDLILSVSVDPLEETADAIYDIKGISNNVNFINLMAFQFHAPSYYEKQGGVGHTSPLYRPLHVQGEELKKNIAYVMTYWIEHGALVNKLTLGISFHGGESYILANTKHVGRGAPYTTVGPNFQYFQPAYSKICAWLEKKDFKYLFDKDQQVPYIYNENKYIIPYEDVASIEAKAKYLNKLKVRGAVVQYIDEDDIYGKCGEKYTLMKALNKNL